MFSQIFSSITASVGNLLVIGDMEKSYKIYKNMLFVNSWIYSFASIAILALMQPFISIWVGEKYLLSNGVLIVLAINFYVQGMRKTSNTFKEAAGIFHEDRIIPIIESFTNIIASIVFIKIWGLKGVFMGTILSSMILFLYSYPVYVYKVLFGKKYIEYLKEHIEYLIISLISALITMSVINAVVFPNNWMQLFFNLVMVIILPNLIQYLFFRKKEEYIYIKNMIKNIKK